MITLLYFSLFFPNKKGKNWVKEGGKAQSEVTKKLNDSYRSKSRVPAGQSGRAGSRGAAGGTSATFQKAGSMKWGGMGVEGRAPHNLYTISETKPTCNI